MDRRDYTPAKVVAAQELDRAFEEAHGHLAQLTEAIRSIHCVDPKCMNCTPKHPWHVEAQKSLRRADMLDGEVEVIW